MLSTDDIIAAARSQLGVSFKHQGRVDGKFLDCAGLAAIVAKRIGVEYNEWPGYGRIPYRGMLEFIMDSQPSLMRVYTMQPGDILLMRLAREPNHLAFYTGENIIHCYCMIGQVCEHRLDSVWRKRISGIYRFKDIGSVAAD